MNYDEFINNIPKNTAKTFLTALAIFDKNKSQKMTFSNEEEYVEKELSVLDNTCLALFLATLIEDEIVKSIFNVYCLDIKDILPYYHLNNLKISPLTYEKNYFYYENIFKEVINNLINKQPIQNFNSQDLAINLFNPKLTKSVALNLLFNIDDISLKMTLFLATLKDDFKLTNNSLESTLFPKEDLEYIPFLVAYLMTDFNGEEFTLDNYQNTLKECEDLYKYSNELYEQLLTQVKNNIKSNIELKTNISFLPKKR